MTLIARTKDTCCGMPRIAGTRLKTALIKGLYDDGTSVEMIALLYGLTKDQVKAAINYGRTEKI